MRRGLVLAGIGVAFGLGAAVSVTRLMRSLLFGISPLDPPTFVTASLLFVIVATVAACVPARGATRLDPMTVLRLE